MEASSPTAAVVLAAGQGKRLHSDVPKVLHLAAGRPLLIHVLFSLGPLPLSDRVVVTAPHVEIPSVVKAAGFDDVRFAVQDPARGTGDAVRVAMEELVPGSRDVLVVCGDTPGLKADTLTELVAIHKDRGAEATLLTAMLDPPSGEGRIVRGVDGDVDRIVEERDTTEAELNIREINAGVYVFREETLRRLLGALETDNAQAEFYLTDVIGLIRSEGGLVVAISADAQEIAGVNSRSELARVSRSLREEACERWMDAGVTIIDPQSTFIDVTVELARDVVLLPFTFLEGNTKIAQGARIGPQTRIVDSEIAAGATVSFSVVAGSSVGPEASVGPFASLRPGSKLGRSVHVGSFVEIKATTMGDGSKAGHLAYLGDAEIGRDVNIGAGTITCNWDGQQKNPTLIEDDVYIGSDTMLVAPVQIRARAATGAGAVVKDEVPEDALAVGVPARIISGKGDKMRRGASDSPAKPRQ
ncbi:MAG: bifunctional UDP-N-acetylglucosamine pyrophosphorylase / glucosamine-phosphate N-acetyltransferase [Actinomycetota bacterium]|nr:bifunctional UDP-N-acetylglucosamine pyrophosphorylase / glucosamine-phosphate N-acetyltransferase [Actinomycetota bacterium]